MTGLYLLSYLVAPVAMLAAFLGCGLLVRRAGGGRLPAVYVLPVGFATVVTVSAFLTTWDPTAELAGPSLVVLTVAGLTLERRHLRGRLAPMTRWVWAAGAAFGAFAVVLGPAALSGRATFTGYGRIVDIATQFDFGRYLVTEGRLRPADRATSFTEVITKTLDIGYPGGAQSAHGAFSTVLGVDLPWTYQAFLAVAAAMTALAIYGLLGGAIGSRPLRALGAGIAAQPNVLIGYGLVGGIKELVSASLLVLTAAIVRETVPERGSVREMLPLAVATAACLAAFNLTIVPWLGLLLAGFFVVSVALGRRWMTRQVLRPLSAWGAMAVMTLAMAAPTLWQALKLIPVAAQAEGAEGGRTALADLGNLTAPMPVRAVAGVWISGDIRVPALGDTPITAGVIAVIGVLALIGLVAALRRRDWALVLLAGASAVSLTYFVQRTGPWVQLKAITVTSPVVLTLAFAGAGTLLSGAGPRRLGATGLGALAGWSLAGIVTLGVLAGNANAYHDVTLAPTDRLRDLQLIGKRFAGEGPTLYPAFEEHAEYLLRRSDVVGLVTTAGEGTLAPAYRPETQVGRPPVSYARDLDDLLLENVQQFRLLVIRRGPTWSRPPSNFELVHRSRFHDVWRRVAPPSTVLAHVSLPALDPATMQASCRQLVRRARAEPRLRVAYAERPSTRKVELGVAAHSPSWKRFDDDQLRLYGPGQATTAERIPWGGTYRLWLKGPTQRELRISIDGRQVTSTSYAWSYPDQWSWLDTVRLDAGTHKVGLERSAGSLAPGDGAGGTPVGPLVFERVDGGGGVRLAPGRRAAGLCAKADGLDWIELVRTAG